MLTDIEIHNAKPYKLTDGKGLYVHVAPGGGGRKAFRHRYELPPGTESTIVLGEYPAMTLAEARRARDEARALVKAGVSQSIRPQEGAKRGGYGGHTRISSGASGQHRKHPPGNQGGNHVDHPLRRPNQ